MHLFQGRRKVPNIGGAQGKLAHCKPLFFTIDIGWGTFPCATPVPTALYSKIDTNTFSSHYLSQRSVQFCCDYKLQPVINPNELPKHLDLLFKALQTIKPTSVESRHAFSPKN